MDDSSQNDALLSQNPLYRAVGEYLVACQAKGAGSLTEGALLCWLREQALIPAEYLAPAALYRVHFLMRNALYRWALAHDDWHWGFSALGVQWRPVAAGSDAHGNGMPTKVFANCSGTHGELAEYYLELANLQLSEPEVEVMLSGFWRRYGDYLAVQGADLASALALLELEELTDFDSLKRQYRRRAMALHPDRGGSDQDLQALNSAFELARCHLAQNAI